MSVAETYQIEIELVAIKGGNRYDDETPSGVSCGFISGSPYDNITKARIAIGVMQSEACPDLGSKPYCVIGKLS